MEWLFGLTGSLLIAGIAYRKNSLSGSGLLAALLVGTLLYVFGSAAWFGTLIGFFVSSTFWSKWKQHKKTSVEKTYEKTGRRDAGQVLANGGLAVLLAIGNAAWPHPVWWSAFVGVMASVNADTWATEVGALSNRQPRSIVTGKIVPRGTSGGISNLGLIASAAGGAFVGLIAWLFAAVSPGQLGATIPYRGINTLLSLILTGMIAGTIGSLIDSYLGARWQVMFRCQVCTNEVERKVHCDLPTIHTRGFVWMNNDTVNLLSSLGGGTVAIGLLSLFG
jgi:uncharacterized protein (TIGR00297 family)